MNEIKVLEKTYFDEADVIRKVKEKNKKTGITEFSEKTVYENIKCAISKGSSTMSGADISNKINTTRLYCNPNFIIKTGDVIRVTFKNVLKSEFTASEPFFYKSHCQIELIEKDRA